MHPHPHRHRHRRTHGSRAAAVGLVAVALLLVHAALVLAAEHEGHGPGDRHAGGEIGRPGPVRAVPVDAHTTLRTWRGVLWLDPTAGGLVVQDLRGARHLAARVPGAGSGDLAPAPAGQVYTSVGQVQVTEPCGTRGAPVGTGRVLRIDPATSTVVCLATFDGATRLTPGRHGVLYVTQLEDGSHFAISRRGVVVPVARLPEAVTSRTL